MQFRKVKIEQGARAIEELARELLEGCDRDWEEQKAREVGNVALRGLSSSPVKRDFDRLGPRQKYKAQIWTKPYH